MPAPVSSTRSTASPPWLATSTITRPPAGVNFTALPTRLLRICSSRVSSASIHTDPLASHCR